MKVDIRGAVEHTGLTEYAIRRAVWAKKLPVWRTGNGKMIFDTDLLDKAIEKEMMRNFE
jgi:hypothetical protein